MVTSVVFTLAMVGLFFVLALTGAVLQARPRLAALLAPGAVLVGWGLWRAGQAGSLPYLGAALITGFAVRAAVARGATLWRATLVGLTPLMLASVVPLLVATPTGTWSELEREVERWAVRSDGELPADAGPEERALVTKHRDMAQKAAGWMMRLFPAEILLFNLMLVLGVVVLAGGSVGRTGVPVRVLPVRNWRLPFTIVWGLVVGLGLVALRQSWSLVVGLNVTLVVAGLLAIQGCAVMWTLLSRSTPAPVRGLLLGLAVVTAFPFAAVAAALVGLADLWLDLRQRAAVRSQSR